MLRILRQKVSGVTMAAQPYAKRSNFVPVKRVIGEGDQKRYIDLVFWREKRLVQVAYVPSMNAIVFVDVEKIVKDWEYRVMINEAIKASERVNKAISSNKAPSKKDIEIMESVYEVPDPELMKIYSKVLFELPVTGETNVAAINEFKNDNKSENKIVFGPIENVVVVIRVSKVLQDYQDKYGEHKNGNIYASVSSMIFDETLGAEPAEKAETKKVEVIKSSRERKVS